MMKEKKIYILLTDTGTLFTRLIKIFTKKPYNHASISFDAELSEVYSFGRKKVNNPFDGGFVKEDVEEGLFKNANCIIYSLSVTDEQLKKMKAYVTKMDKQKEDFRYNFIGLFGFIINKPIKRKKAFFCSQFVASVLKNSNVVDFRKPISLIAPNDLQVINGLEQVYEGQLHDYINKDERNIRSYPISLIPVEM